MVFEEIVSKYPTACVILSIILVIGCWIYIKLPKFIKNVPILKSDSIIGYSAPFATSTSNGKFDSHKTVYEAAQKHGKLAQFTSMGYHVILVNDSYIMKHVLERVHGKGFLHRGNPKFNNAHLFNMDTGAEWKLRRSSYRHAFSMNSLRSSQSVIVDLTDKMCSMLDKSAESKTVVSIDKVFGLFAVDIISKTAFQMDLGALDGSELSKVVTEDVQCIFETFWLTLLPLADWIFFLFPNFHLCKRYMTSKLRIDEFKVTILEHIQRLEAEGGLKEGGVGRSLLDLKANNNHITEQDLREDIAILFIAGYETTAHTMSFCLYCIARYPEVQKKCHEAVDQWNGDDGTLPPYVEAVLKESMRRYPVAGRGSIRLVTDPAGITIPTEVLNKSDEWLPKTQPKPHKPFTSDIHVPCGSWFILNFFNTFNNDATWGPGAFDFRPERWLNHSDTDGVSNPLSSSAVYAGAPTGAKGESVGFAPFSLGPRNCLGMNMALLEARVVLLKLLKKYEFNLVDDSFLDEHEMIETTFTLRPKDGLPLILKKRG